MSEDGRTDEQAAGGPGRLPRPAMWPEGAGDTPFNDLPGDDEQLPEPTARRRYQAWVAVALMVVAAVLLGLAVVLQSWVPAVVAVVLGGIGLVLALRAQIFEDVSLSA